MNKITNRFLRDFLITSLTSGLAWAIYTSSYQGWKNSVIISAILSGACIGFSFALFTNAKDLLSKITLLQNAFVSKAPISKWIDRMKIEPINSFWTLSKASALFGAKTGSILSTLYLFFSILLLGIMIIVEFINGHGGDNLIVTFFGGTILIAVVGSIVGVIPSIIVGIISAMGISAALWILRRRLSTFLSIVIGISICSGFVILVDYTLWSTFGAGDSMSETGISYAVWRGIPIPIVIYILAGGYASWKLFTFLTAALNDTASQSNNQETKGNYVKG
jgi:hypothetical protein